MLVGVFLKRSNRAMERADRSQGTGVRGQSFGFRISSFLLLVSGDKAVEHSINKLCRMGHAKPLGQLDRFVDGDSIRRAEK